MGSATIAPLGVRMSPELKTYLKGRARENHRSLNAEIVMRLEESRAKELTQVRRGADGRE